MSTAASRLIWRTESQKQLLSPCNSWRGFRPISAIDETTTSMQSASGHCSDTAARTPEAMPNITRSHNVGSHSATSDRCRRARADARRFSPGAAYAAPTSSRRWATKTLRTSWLRRMRRLFPGFSSSGVTKAPCSASSISAYRARTPYASDARLDRRLEAPTNHALRRDRGEGKQRAFMRRITFGAGRIDNSASFGITGRARSSMDRPKRRGPQCKRSERQSEEKLADEARKSEGPEIFNAIG